MRARDWLYITLVPLMCLCCSLCLTPNLVHRDLTTFERPWTPNHALAALPGLTRATPDRDGPLFALPRDTVLAAVRRVLTAQPRTVLVRPADHGDGATDDTLVFVQRSLVWRFPDTVYVKAVDMAGGKTSLIIFSASAYGHGDLGVNLARVNSWIAQLEKELTGETTATVTAQPSSPLTARNTANGARYE
eukprot:m.118662 g.118662  ORF g.118662 m.118662 type:complete len:190 (+) comp10989_c0_seq1:173-742(+)